MLKLYLVHLRPLGLHGILVVILSIQVPVVPSCHGTTQDIPGTLHHHTPSCCPKLPLDNSGHPGNLPLPYTIPPVPGPSCPKLPWDNPGHPGNPPLPYTILQIFHSTAQPLKSTMTVSRMASRHWQAWMS